MIGYVPSDRWERVVYDELKRQLPADWVVVTNVAWSKVTKSEEGTHSPYVRDGEADAVVLVPGEGFVVMEVKGSRAFRIAENGRWYRLSLNGKHEVELQEPPPKQATRNMHDLKQRVLDTAGWARFPGLYAYLVVYPQGRLVTPMPPLHDATTLIMATQMGDLTGRIRGALRARGHQPPEGSPRFDGAAMERVLDVLVNRPLEITKADTAGEVREDTQGIERLTRQQFAALRGIFAHPRVAVTGPAGSGKTVLAMWRLAALIEEGHRAAYVCFNSALALHLQLTHPDLSAHIKSADKWFRDILVSTGASGQDLEVRGSLEEHFQEVLPGMLVDRSALLPAEARYDALIVDEGQDFGESRLIALLELLAGESSQYLFFADRGQDLYGSGSVGAIGAEVTFSLHHNCRNTARINDTNNGLTGLNVDSMPGVPEGVEPLFARCKSREGMAKRAWELARDWSTAGGSVAILSPFKLENSAMAGSLIGHGLRLTQDLAELRGPGRVFFSTIKSFKGIEADSVIVVDVVRPVEGTAMGRNDLSVACTRARARLALVSMTVDEANWLRELS